MIKTSSDTEQIFNLFMEFFFISNLCKNALFY